MALKLNSILRNAGLDPEQITVLLHTPKERGLAAVLPHYAAEQPELFEAYQSSHGRAAEATLKNRPEVISFVRCDGGNLAFVGHYRINNIESRSVEDLRADSRVAYLKVEHDGFTELDNPTVKDWNWFDMERTGVLDELKGRLQIRPRLTQSYARIAAALDADIVALSETSILKTHMPHWRELVLTASSLKHLPSLWRARISQWRGIYMILDESDGKQYVGAAYGKENMLQRWQEHVTGEVGVTAKLKKRSVKNFRFSVLQLLSQDADIKTVTEIEQSWMTRLHSREFGLNS